VRVNTSQCEQYGVTVHLFIGTGRSPVEITFISSITNYKRDTNYHGLIGLFLFKSQGVSLCRISPDCNFGVYLRVVSACMSSCQRCFCLEDLRRRRSPLTVAPSRCLIVFRNELDPRKISKASECRRSKNTLSELIAEKRLKYSRCRVVHRSANTGDLAVHLPSAEWSTVQRTQAIWRFTFPPAALYKQTGWCRVTTTFIVIALLCC
jgi:hypothetical protein